jgi:hypothetical protein
VEGVENILAGISEPLVRSLFYMKTNLALELTILPLSVY